MYLLRDKGGYMYIVICVIGFIIDRVMKYLALTYEPLISQGLISLTKGKWIYTCIKKL